MPNVRRSRRRADPRIILWLGKLSSKPAAQRHHSLRRLALRPRRDTDDGLLTCEASCTTLLLGRCVILDVGARCCRACAPRARSSGPNRGARALVHLHLVNAQCNQPDIGHLTRLKGKRQEVSCRNRVPPPPEYWWAVAWLSEFWLTVALARQRWRESPGHLETIIPNSETTYN